MRKGFFAFLLAGMTAVSFNAAASDISLEQVVLRGLDKVTGRLSTMTVNVGEKAEFGALDIYVRVCVTHPPEETPENAAFLQVVEKKPEGQLKLFSGWMFSSSPALSAMEHPVYDVWVLKCQGEPVTPPAPDPLILDRPIEMISAQPRVKITVDGKESSGLEAQPSENENKTGEDNGDEAFSSNDPDAPLLIKVEEDIPVKEKTAAHETSDVSDTESGDDNSSDASSAEGNSASEIEVIEDPVEGAEQPLLRPMSETTAAETNAEEAEDDENGESESDGEPERNATQISVSEDSYYSEDAGASEPVSGVAEEPAVRILRISPLHGADEPDAEAAVNQEPADGQEEAASGQGEGTGATKAHVFSGSDVAETTEATEGDALDAIVVEEENVENDAFLILEENRAGESGTILENPLQKEETPEEF